MNTQATKLAFLLLAVILICAAIFSQTEQPFPEPWPQPPSPSPDPLPLPKADDSYAIAYRRAELNGRPLEILLTARWCRPCREVERRCLDALREKGELAIVDIDKGKELANEIAPNLPLIPRLVVWQHVVLAWKPIADCTGTEEIARYCGATGVEALPACPANSYHPPLAPTDELPAPPKAQDIVRAWNKAVRNRQEEMWLHGELARPE